MQRAPVNFEQRIAVTNASRVERACLAQAFDFDSAPDRALPEHVDDIDQARSDESESQGACGASGSDVFRDKVNDGEEARAAQLSDGNVRIGGGERRDHREDKETEQ